MKRRHASLVTGVVAAAIALSAYAQTGETAAEVAAPDYGSHASVRGLSNRNFNTPESDGRPGVYYFDLGVQAFKKGDYRHAIDMYKVAASWAYKPAEYNLAIMYFKGQGVPADHARGAAWMILAAERGDPLYAKARDLMVTALSKPEFQQTDEIWNQLKPTYADAVALGRAKARWAWAGSHETGTHIAGGLPGYLRVGEAAQGAPKEKGYTPVPRTAAGVLTGGSLDGSIAYQQFQQSSNPYDPVFLKHHSGNVMVEPLKQIKSGGDKHPPLQKDGSASSSAPPIHNA